MTNLLEKAINCDDGDRAAKMIQDALGIESDDVANYCFPKTWPADREVRARIIGNWLQAGGAPSVLTTWADDSGSCKAGSRCASCGSNPGIHKYTPLQNQIHGAHGKSGRIAVFSIVAARTANRHW